MEPDLRTIGRRFAIEGDFLSGGPYGHGHINDTYAVVYRLGSRQRRVILQRINHKVFMNPEGLMVNIVAGTRHLSRKSRAAGGDPLRETLTVIPSLEGEALLETEGAEYWRADEFIQGAQRDEKGGRPGPGR